MKTETFFLLFFLAATVVGQSTTTSTNYPDPAADIIARVNDVLCLLIGIVQYVAAGITALVIILAGFKYMSSADDPAERDKAKNMIVYAFVGLIIVIIVCPVVDYLVENTGIVPFSKSCDCMIDVQYRGTTPITNPLAPTTTIGGGPAPSTTLVGGGVTTTQATVTTLPMQFNCGIQSDENPRTVCENAENDAENGCSFLDQIGSDCRNYCCQTFSACC